jgi:methyltransferase (TIGR00027 family)
VIQLTNGPITLGRSRYTEDCLAEALARGATQYVLLGAGLDSYAYRRAYLRAVGWVDPAADELQIFELDHPVTQAIKTERFARLGLPEPANLHSLAVDFTQGRLADAFQRSSYDPRQVSFFNWLGVSYYLTREVVLETLRGLAALAAPGSQVVFDYLDREAFIPEKATQRMRQMQWMAAQIGEPLKSGFGDDELAEELTRLGLRLEETLDPATIDMRVFRGEDGQPRDDLYRSVDHFHYARAVVERQA